MTTHAPDTLMRRIAVAAVGVAGLMVAMKAAAYLATDSVAMMASMADSALDLFASCINLIAVRQALVPADNEHRFGHGKAEPLAGLAQGAFIAGSAAYLVIASVERLISPQPVAHGLIGIVVMLVAIVLTLMLVTAQRFVVRRTGSIAIRADSLHYVGDLAGNLGALIGIVLATRFGFITADALFGLAIAGLLFWSAWQVFRQSYDQLMDRELADEDRERIKSIVRANPEVRSMHDLRTRAAGRSTFIQLHIELDPEIGLMRAHAISDAVEEALCAAFPNAEVIIHQDPAGVERPPALARV